MTIMYRLFLFAILALWTVPCLAGKPVILVLGDSLSAGYGIEADAAWPALLQQRLVAQKRSYKVINASVSGDTTRTALNRLPHALNNHQPRIVIVAVGANDGLRGLPFNEMRASLLSIVQRSKEQGAKVVLVGVRLPTNYGKVFVDRFTGVFREVAEETDVPLVPYLLEGVAENGDLFQEDRLHPTAEAQPLILENVWARLSSML